MTLSLKKMASSLVLAFKYRNSIEHHFLYHQVLNEIDILY